MERKNKILYRGWNGKGLIYLCVIDEREETVEDGAEWSFGGGVVETAGGAVWGGESQV